MSSRQGQSSAGNSACFVVVPPPNFSYVEDSLCRCTHPLSQNSITYVKSIGIGIIVNLCDAKSSTHLLNSLADEHDIILKTPPHDREDFAFENIAAFEAWIASTLEFIISQCCMQPTLLIGSSPHNMDCVVIGE